MTGRGRRTPAPSAALQAVADEFAPEVIVEFSARRKKTVSASPRDGRIIVRSPLAIDPHHLRSVIEKLVKRVERRTSRHSSDEELWQRAMDLNRTYLEGRAIPLSVRWVSNMSQRWGSCTTTTGEIRISDRLRLVPEYVLNQVIIHELVHTFISGHTPEFYAWARRAPFYERAEGYLEAYQRWATSDPTQGK